MHNAPVTALDLLQLLFLALELTHQIEWNWALILAPAIFWATLTGINAINKSIIK